MTYSTTVDRVHECCGKVKKHCAAHISATERLCFDVVQDTRPHFVHLLLEYGPQRFKGQVCHTSSKNIHD